MLGMFGPKSDKIRAYRGLLSTGPFKKDFSSASRVINEVVLGTSVNSYSSPTTHPFHRQFIVVRQYENMVP